MTLPRSAETAAIVADLLVGVRGLHCAHLLVRHDMRAAAHAVRADIATVYARPDDRCLREYLLAMVDAWATGRHDVVERGLAAYRRTGAAAGRDAMGAGA